MGSNDGESFAYISMGNGDDFPPGAATITPTITMNGVPLIVNSTSPVDDTLVIELATPVIAGQMLVATFPEQYPYCPILLAAQVGGV